MFQPHVVKAVQANLEHSPDNRGFAEALEGAIAYPEGLPRTFSLTFRVEAAPTAMGRSPSEALSNVLKEIHGWLGFLIFSNAYKAEQLAKDIVDGLNALRCMRVTSGGFVNRCVNGIRRRPPSG